jgi:hypothetical protein
VGIRLKTELAVPKEFNPSVVKLAIRTEASLTA